MYRIHSRKWQLGPDYPLAVTNAAMVDDKKGGVVVIGGELNVRKV
jgi:hypothetical protein